MRAVTGLNQAYCGTFVLSEPFEIWTKSDILLSAKCRAVHAPMFTKAQLLLAGAV
jgi:hypothetical protein